MAEHIGGTEKFTEAEQAQIDKMLAIFKKMSPAQKAVIQKGMEELNRESIQTPKSEKPEGFPDRVHFRRSGDVITVNKDITMEPGGSCMLPSGKGSLALRKDSDGTLFMDAFDKDDSLRSSTPLLDERMYDFDEETWKPKLIEKASALLHRLT